MSRYDYERVSKIHPAGTVLETDAYGVIRHVGIATGYGTVIHSSRRYGQVLETSENSSHAGNPYAQYRMHRLYPAQRRCCQSARKNWPALWRSDAQLRAFRDNGSFLDKRAVGQLGPLDLGRL